MRPAFDEPVAQYDVRARSPAMKWLSEQATDGVRQRSFIVEHGAGSVPGVLWTADRDQEPAALVLIGHGGAGDKSDESRVELGRAYVLEHGCAAAAIDGPWHGDRSLPSDTERPAATPETVDGMVADWVATLDALSELAEIDGSRVGYGGVSMGTMFGIPLVAAEPRIKAAVLGLCGLTRPSGDTPNITERLKEDAPRVRQPTLFLVQWDDELFPREGAFALFDLLGADDKRLYAHPGRHHETPAHARATTAAFLAGRLTAG